MEFSLEEWVEYVARRVECDPAAVRSLLGWWRSGSYLEKAEPLLARHPKLWEMWKQQRAADWFEWPPRR